MRRRLLSSTRTFCRTAVRFGINIGHRITSKVASLPFKRLISAKRILYGIPIAAAIKLSVNKDIKEINREIENIPVSSTEEAYFKENYQLLLLNIDNLNIDTICLALAYCPEFAKEFVTYVIRNDKLPLLFELYNNFHIFKYIFDAIDNQKEILFAEYLFKNLDIIVSKNQAMIGSIAYMSTVFCDLIAKSIMEGDTKILEQINGERNIKFIFNTSARIGNSILDYISHNLDKVPPNLIIEGLGLHYHTEKHTQELVEHIVNKKDYALLRKFEGYHLDIINKNKKAGQELSAFVIANGMEIYKINKRIIDHMILHDTEFREKLAHHMHASNEVFTDCSRLLLGNLYKVSESSQSLLETVYLNNFEKLEPCDLVVIATHWNIIYVNSLLNRLEAIKSKSAEIVRQILRERVHADSTFDVKMKARMHV